MRSTADELALLRRIAQVASQIQQAESHYIRERAAGYEQGQLALLPLRDLKHQMRRLLRDYATAKGEKPWVRR